MPDANTPNYNFVLPEVGFSADTWGTKLNQNWTDIDGLLKQVEDFSQLTVLKAGDSMSGPLVMTTTDPAVSPHQVIFNGTVPAINIANLGPGGGITITGPGDSTALNVTGGITQTGDAQCTFTNTQGSPIRSINPNPDGGLGVWFNGDELKYQLQTVTSSVGRFEVFNLTDFNIMLNSSVYFRALDSTVQQTLLPEAYKDTTTASANMTIQSNGRVRRSTSSRAHKDNIATIDAHEAMQAMLSLNPVQFTSILDGDDEVDVQMGFIAEETVEVLPEAGYMQDGTNYDVRAVVSVLTKCVQELTGEVADLQRQIKQLSH